MIKRASRLPAAIFVMLFIIMSTVGCQQKDATSVSQSLPSDLSNGNKIEQTNIPNTDSEQQDKELEPIEISSKDGSTNEHEANDAEPLEDSSKSEDDVPSADPNAQHNDPMETESSDSNVEQSTERDSENDAANNQLNAADRYFLLGISTHTTKAEVNARFPKPNDTFSMPDANGTLTIYDFGSYMIGFNTANHIVFIDVFAEELDTGLQGVNVGSSASDAIRILGQPTSQSDYVLNYKKGNTVLKMDLDPESQRILSIKLFTEE